MSSLRIAVYHNLHSGGAIHTLWEQVRRLSQRHEIVLFTLSTADRSSYDFDSYVAEERVQTFRPGPSFRRPWGRLNPIVRTTDLLHLQEVGRGLAREIDAGDFDVALVHPCQFTQSPSLLRHLITPVVYYCQEPLRRLYEPSISRPYLHRSSIRRVLDGVDPGLHMYRFVIQRNDRRAIQSAVRVLVNSAYTQANVRRFYGVNGLVCYHGVDWKRFRPLSLPRDNHLLSVGALVSHKGFDFLIDALGFLPSDRRPSLHLICNYAEEQERSYLEDRARDRDVTLIIRVAISGEELIEAYNRAFAVVYAPHREPFGLVPLEAMACGTPVVAVSEGGVTETVVHGRNGLLTPRDPQAFADAVAHLLDDPDHGAELGCQARQYVLERWGWDAAVRCVEAQLVDIAQQGSTAR